MAVVMQASAARVVLFVALSLLIADLLTDWDNYAKCPKPINQWLLASYLLLGLLAAVVMAARALGSGDAGNFLLNARPKGTIVKVLFSGFWFVLVPLFTACSVLGTLWAWEVRSRAPSCVPSSTHMTFLIMWQVVNWFWIFFYIGIGFLSYQAECRIRRTERDLRELEDPDLVARWGHVGNLGEYTQVPAQMASGGLTPAQIRGLAGVTTYMEPAGRPEDCPICMSEIREGDIVRELDGCRHTFHRCCLDLWLLRSAECPLCKHNVLAGGAASE